MTYGGNRLVCSHLGGRVGPSKCNVHCERSHIFLFLIKYLVHILLAVTARFLVSFIKTPVLHKISVLKARIHCEISLSDYFMKHSLMHILLHLIWFHEIRIKYVKRKPPRTIIRKKAISPCLPHLHVVDIGWSVSHEKFIFTGDCFSNRLFYQR